MSDEGRVARRKERPAARTAVRSAPALGPAPVVTVDESLIEEKYRGYGFPMDLIEKFREFDRLQSRAAESRPALAATAVVPDLAKARQEANTLLSGIAEKMNSRLMLTNDSASELHARLAETEARLAEKEAKVSTLLRGLQLMRLVDADPVPPHEEHVVSESEVDPEQPEEVRDGGYFSSVLPT